MIMGMEIIPVLDVARGVAVHARGGDRAAYEPVRSVLVHDDDPADPRTLVRAYRGGLGADACYLADLDAIQGGPVQRGLLRELAAFQTGFAGELLVDAGTSAAEGAREILSCGASDVVVGLETLRSFADLCDIVAEVGASRVVFSLDLRVGQPALHPVLRASMDTAPDALELADRAVDSGVWAILLLDMGRVGTGAGVDVEFLAVLRGRYPGLRLLAGGGISTRADLDRLADAGCDGALVASAVHAGRVTAADVSALRRRRARGQSGTSASR
jgi:phosphoribosylformimino-5-aminoimidazole carboxamide ribotide isomerase